MRWFLSITSDKALDLGLYEEVVLKNLEKIKKESNDVRRFMKRTAKTKSGEKAEVEYILDEDEIAEEKI